MFDWLIELGRRIAAKATEAALRAALQAVLDAMEAAVAVFMAQVEEILGTWVAA